jgi:tetratricopeptide (TPR) repeat protein
MAAMRYLDFDIAIERENERYCARVIRSPSGEAEARFDSPLTDLELRDFGNEVVRARQGVRGLNTASVDRVKEYGGRLYAAVFSGEVLNCLMASLSEVRNRPDTGLRIRMRLNGAPELSKLPWEYLYRSNKNSFLGLAMATPIVRYLDLPDSARPLKVQSPIRILVMISSPKDYPQLDTEVEFGHLKEALADLEERGAVELHCLRNATLNELRWELRKEEYHVFHFIGHGGIDPASQRGVLVLEDDKGNAMNASAERLGVVLHEEQTLRLAVLNACEGCRAGSTDIFSGTAQTLIQQDVPAVVAMQFEISDTAAVTFARDFYRALAFGDPVDAAVSQARQAIYTENELEWGTPVLYMRSSDGQLFDIDSSETTSTKRKVAPPPAPPSSPQPPAIPELLDKARVAFMAERWSDANDFLQAILARDPGNDPARELLKQVSERKEVDALYQTGSAHLAAGRWREASGSFSSIRKQVGRYKNSDDLLKQAQDALKRVIEQQEATQKAEKLVAELSGRVPKPKRWNFWLIGGIAALVIVVLGVVGTLMMKVPNRDAELAKAGYLLEGEPLKGSLRENTSDTHSIYLTPGREYRIAGSCDMSCKNMDLHLTDAADAPMLHDQEGDNIPWVDVKVTEAGNYRLQVHMVKCSAEPCYYRVGLYQRRTATQ